MPANHFGLGDLMNLLSTKAGLPKSAHTTDPTATLDDVGLDSLAYLQVQLGVRERYGVELADELVTAAMGDIVDKVNAGLTEGSVR